MVTLAPMLGCACWAWTAIIAFAVLGAISTLGIWRHRRALDRTRTKL
ncbi:MAG TPA: hypothetical protein VFC99_15360 [Acidimicrobiia bacterium]|nr:hypothetical protein [Acidimicrobiia bacterium]